MRSAVPVPDLDQGLQFYRDQLGHELVWRNDAEGQVGLRLPESQAELLDRLRSGSVFVGREGEEADVGGSASSATSSI